MEAVSSAQFAIMAGRVTMKLNVNVQITLQDQNVNSVARAISGLPVYHFHTSQKQYLPTLLTLEV